MLSRTTVVYLILNSRVLFAQLDSKELNEYDWSVWCKFQPNGNDCTERGSQSWRFYYDIKLEGCRTFNYGGCPNSFNNFNTLRSCHDSCRNVGMHPLMENVTQKVYCRLQPDFGRCNEYHPMYYFDINERKCVGFSYSGCGGNKNRFYNAQMCAAVCVPHFDP